MALYAGERSLGGSLVTIDGVPLPDCREVHAFSRTGFEWGFEGPGPRQLALALLAHHLGDPARALELSAGFMRTVVSQFDNVWELTGEEVAAALPGL